MVSLNSHSVLHSTEILERSLANQSPHTGATHSQLQIVQPPKKLVMIDSTVENHRVLAKQMVADTKTFVLTADSDGIEQITKILQRHTEIVSLHIISNNTFDHFSLGSTKLDLNLLDRYAWDLQDWCSSFSATGIGKIVLYGCKAVAGENGFEFVHRFSQLTGVDMIASGTQDFAFSTS